MKVDYENFRVKKCLMTVKDHIKTCVLLETLDLTDTNITFMHYLITAVIYTVIIYISFLVHNLMSLKIIKLATSIFFPIVPVIGCFSIIFISLACGKFYALFLEENDIKIYYLTLVSNIYLALVLLVSAFITSLSGILYVCAGIASDYFLRESIDKGRVWEDPQDRKYFITLSMLMNFGLYWCILPQFFSH